MLVAAGVLFGIAQDALARRDGRGRYWLTLAAIFVYLSCDEATQIHEKLIPPLRRLLGGEGVLFYPWIVPGAAFALLVALCFRRMLASLPWPTAKWIVLSGAVYVAGAIGGEALGGWYASHHGDHNLTYSFLVAVEEGLEIAGLTLFLRSLLDYATGAAAVGSTIARTETAKDAPTPPRSPDVTDSPTPPAPDYRLPTRPRRVA
jgi:hypothetical protein